MYRASIGITTHMKVKATRWIAQHADEFGAHSIWIGEDIGIGQDVFVLTGAMAHSTKRCRIGTAIVPIATHHIMTLARGALALHEVSQGRFVFGTGIGGIQDLRRLSITIKKPVTELRKAVATLQRLWRGERVTAESELFKLNGAELRIENQATIPVFLGVRGPQMLRLVGEVANGAILSGPLDYLKYAVGEIESSARKHGRNPKEIEKVAWLPTIPTFKGGDETLAKKVVAIVVADMPQQIVEGLKVDQNAISELKQAVSAEGPDAGIPFVTDELIDMFAIAGDLEHMVDMFEKVATLGINEIVLGPPFTGDWRGAMQDIFDEIKHRRK